MSIFIIIMSVKNSFGCLPVYFFVVTLIFMQVANSSVKNPEKVPWPQTFYESFSLLIGFNETQKQTTGNHWYNWNIKSMQLDYSNSEVFHSCYQNIKMNTPCTILYGNKQSYIYFPQRRMCCYLGDEDSIPAPDDITQDFIYNTTGSLNGQKYYIWALNDEEQIINYYTTMDSKQVTRRFYYPQVQTNYDYLLSTFTENITNPSVFKVPSYCSKERFCVPGSKDKFFIHGSIFSPSMPNMKAIQQEQ